MNLSEKISPLIRFQFPEYFQSDYPVFIEFLRAYYEWMEQSGHPQEVIQNTLLYGDIDSTLDEFIDYFIREFYDKIPRTVLLDKKVLLKYIDSLYSTKGSQRSYDLLFRILYDTDVESFYPKTKVFRASDGKWIRNVSIFLKIYKGTITDLENRQVIIHSPDNTSRYELNIERYRKAENVYGSDDVHEFFIDDSTNIPINPGDIIEFENFYAEVSATPARYKIITPGTGFRVGDILRVQIDEGRRSRAKVIKVDEKGGIRAIQYISFGTNYTDLEFYNYFSAKKTLPEKALYSMTDSAFVIEDVITRIYEDGIFFQSDYVRDSFRYDYVGKIVRQFKTEMGVDAVGDDSDAIIMIIPGGKAKYPGYYRSNDSFPSDDIYLQDYHYFQPFSYVLRVDEQLEIYKRAVLENIHPAGTRLFAEYLLKTDINIPTTVQVTKDDVEKDMDTDLFQAIDYLNYGYYMWNLDEPNIYDDILKDFHGYRYDLVDAIDVEDSPSKWVVKSISEEGNLNIDDWVAYDYIKESDDSVPVVDDGFEFDTDIYLKLSDFCEIDEELDYWNGELIILPVYRIIEDEIIAEEVTDLAKFIYLSAHNIYLEAEQPIEASDIHSAIKRNDHIINLEIDDIPLDPDDNL